MAEPKTLAAVETSGGTVLLTVLPSDELSIAEPRLTGPHDVADDSSHRLEGVLASVHQVTAELMTSLSGLHVTRAEIEFGLTFSVKSGKLLAAIVEAGQECAFKVTVEWAPSE